MNRSSFIDDDLGRSGPPHWTGLAFSDLSLRSVLAMSGLASRSHAWLVPVVTGIISVVGCDLTIAVGTLITERPPHRSEQAQFGHSAPTSGV